MTEAGEPWKSANEIETLRRELEEAREPVRALRAGEVDAVVAAEEERVFLLEPPERGYRLLVGLLREAAATLTAEGIVRHCNAHFARLLGRTADELAGRPLADFAAPGAREELAAVFAAGAVEAAPTEVPFEREGGGGSPVRLRLAPLEEGPLGSRLLVVDVTEERQIDELRAAQEALRASDRQKDEFLATLAHELRNPLAPIRNAVEMLKLRDLAPEQLDWCREVLDRQVDLVARLLDDLSDVASVSRHAMDLRRRRVDLGDVLSAVVETNRPAAEASGQALEVELPEGPVPLEADPARLTQVFSNLLNNAAKYTDPGGRIDVRCRVEGEEAAVAVSDTGIGIPPDILPRVFDLFVQAEPGHERTQGGIGIGLALARGLVELHGGRVEAASEGPGRGSTFTVRLPLAEEGAREGEGTADHSFAGVSGRCVLVADDFRDGADTLARLLEIRGCRVVTAYDGAEACERAAELRPDAILLDLVMPGLDGYEACHRIRSEPWGRDVLIVALSGRGEEEDRRRALEAGFDEHLVKPVDAGAIIGLLART